MSISLYDLKGIYHGDRYIYRPSRLLRGAAFTGGVPRRRAEKKLSSENVARQVLVLRQLAQPGVDVSGVDRHRSRPALARVEGNFLEQLLQHRVKAPRADVLGLLVHLEGDLRDAADGFGPELYLQALRLEQRLVLLHLARVGGHEDALEVLDRERVELDADREAPLQLGNQIRGLGEVERARGDEQNVVGLHHAVARRHRGAFDQRQQVALHALARDVGAADVAAARDLVDLVEEHDAVLLGVGERARLQLVVVDQPACFLLGQQLGRLADLHAPQPPPPAAEVGQHALDLRGELLHARRGEDLHLRLARRHLDVDLLVVELALAQLLPEFLPGGVFLDLSRAGGRQQRIENPLLGSFLRPRAHAARRLLAGLLYADLDQVAHDGIDVAADVAHLGELGRLDLDERRVGEPRQATGNLGLAHAGRADQQDVLRRDLLTQGLGYLLAPPAVAQRDGDRALRPPLPDDVLVELVHDLLRRHAAHSSTSMLRW